MNTPTNKHMIICLASWVGDTPKDKMSSNSPDQWSKPKLIGFEMALYLQITKAFHYLPTQTVGQHNHLVQ